MDALQLVQHFKSLAGRALVLRAAIVGLNFAVMAALAAGLGLAEFGRLAVAWGLALIVSTVLSVGAPVLFLRAITEGVGLNPRTVVLQAALYPLLLAALAVPFLELFWPGYAWAQVFFVALMVNSLHCLAAIMRALGSVQASMAMRDACPQVSLGIGAMLNTADPLSGAFPVMAVFSVLMVTWILGRAGLSRRVSNAYPTLPIDLSLWWSAILGMVQSQADIVVGGAILPDGQVGFYALARRVINLIALPVTVATWVSSPSISRAYGQRDPHRLRGASRQNSFLALWPGLALAGIGMVAVPILALSDAWPPFATPVCLLLLIGVVVQLCFSATQTVATLCHLAQYTALSRLSSVLLYLALVQAIPVQDMVSNALAFVAGLVIGTLGLWLVVWHQLAVDTSALALWRKGGRWSPS